MKYVESTVERASWMVLMIELSAVRTLLAAQWGHCLLESNEGQMVVDGEKGLLWQCGGLLLSLCCASALWGGGGREKDKC